MTAVHDAGPAPLQLAAPWGGTGWVSDLGGPVHWVDYGGPEADDATQGVPVVMVHGLGGSHLNWVGLAPELSEHHHVYAVDQAGFGLTPGTPQSSSVHANADLVARFIREVVGSPVVLVGNSMGGMVSLLLAAAHPELVAGLVLVDPSLPVPRVRPDLAVSATFLVYATPFLGERYLALMTSRLTDRQRVQGVVNLCFADPSRANAQVVDAGVVLAAHRRGVPAQEAAFLGAARSLMKVLANPRRYHSLIRGIDRPVLLVHGERDRLVPVAAARAVAAQNPTWTTRFLPGVGHTPQLEVPAEVLASVGPWLAAHDLTHRASRTALP
ncbi:Pimeloyl-ACP methyl ester carboxylesterase [Pedococcus dokdonensis]|uniref:Pimeloyl-ACP methyl ester carboxylesterase n=1 Tax=Pedococcus dokdonensis TaxID=443156 RepID=A0A1H0M4G2_9MICO|nr:alpha/beta fold hydrolase [Pedococcus dokdonensis]SDO75191.1 Pimeloyl-ACP methyl ester carboxylesterase [Pedococcus dokdonensis]